MKANGDLLAWIEEEEEEEGLEPMKARMHGYTSHLYLILHSALLNFLESLCNAKIWRSQVLNCQRAYPIRECKGK